MPVTCGNRRRHPDGKPVAHQTVDAVRACYLAVETWACGWQTALVNAEDGEPYVIECDGLTWHLPDNRGYACEFGHDHIYAETRHHEGWDYVADECEAGLLAGRGLEPVSMRGGAIDIDLQAMRYAMSLPG